MFLKAYPVLGFTFPARVPILTIFSSDFCSGNIEFIGIIPFSDSMIWYGPKYFSIKSLRVFFASS